MDFRFNEKAEKLRAEIRDFVKNDLPEGFDQCMEDSSPDDFGMAMQCARLLGQKGWLTIHWPKEYGGMDASTWERVVFNEEVGYWRIPGRDMGISGTGWNGPSIIKFGTPEQKAKYLPSIAKGELDGVWCTGYSEPDAGSDFANFRMRAEKVGNEYVINGQKLWTSAAHHARWCWLAVRTDPNAEKKHQGISILIVDIKNTPGITIRPIKNYAGYHIFNEVFYDDVHVPAENLVGEEGKGWGMLMQSLAFERGSIAINAYGTTKRGFDDMVQYANETGLIKKAYIRNILAEAAIELESLKMLSYQTMWLFERGGMPIYEPSRDKLQSDMIVKRMARISTKVTGAFTQVDPTFDRSKWADVFNKNVFAAASGFMLAPGLAIAGGTTETQKNIVGMFGLQQPKSY